MEAEATSVLCFPLQSSCPRPHGPVRLLEVQPSWLKSGQQQGAKGTGPSPLKGTSQNPPTSVLLTSWKNDGIATRGLQRGLGRWPDGNRGSVSEAGGESAQVSRCQLRTGGRETWGPWEPFALSHSYHAPQINGMPEACERVKGEDCLSAERGTWRIWPKIHCFSYSPPHHSLFHPS